MLHLITEGEIHSHCLHSKHPAHPEPSGDPSLLRDNIHWESIIITQHERSWGSGTGVLQADWASGFSGNLLTWILHPYENFPKRAAMAGAFLCGEEQRMEIQPLPAAPCQMVACTTVYFKMTQALDS